MVDQKKKDELDLFELFLKAVLAVRKNFWLIVSFFFVGCALGLAYFYSSKKVYESRMIVSSSILTDSYTKVLFENATKHIDQGNTGVLSTQFNISEKTAQDIVALRIENLTKVVSSTPKEMERFLITAEVFDQGILPELQRGIVNYLENNEFAKIRVDQNRAYFKEMLVSVEKEIMDMEEFKTRISSGEFFHSTKGNVMFDPTTVNSKILELTEKKIGFQNSLALSNSIQIIDGFASFKKQAKPKLSVALVSGSLVGLVLVGLLMVFKSVREFLSLNDPVK